MMTEATTDSTDANGNCVHHPAIKIQRQTASGSWKTLLPSCPLCSVRGTTPTRRGSCVDDARRRRSNSSSRGGGTALSLSGGSNENIVTERRLSSSISSRSIADDRCAVDGGGDDDDQGNNRSDNDGNDHLAPLHSQKVHISSHDNIYIQQPPLCKQTCALSISSHTDGTDTTVTSASTCSTMSRQSSRSSGAADVWNIDGEILSPLDCPPLPSSGGLSGITSRRRSSQGSLLPPPHPLSPSTPLLSRQSSSSSRRSSTSSSNTKKSVVCGLKYTNPTSNKRGSYTGQLHPESQLPHGIGILSYMDGSGFCDGEWEEGVLLVANNVMNGRKSSSRTRRASVQSMSSSRTNPSENAAEMNERKSSSRTRRASVQSMSSSHFELKVQHLSNHGGMEDDEGSSSLSQPCAANNGVSSPQDLQLIYAPCSPQPQDNTISRSISRGYQRTGSQGSQGSYRPRHTDERRVTRSQGNISGSNTVVELALPLHFQQQAKMIVDGDDNSLGTCDKSHCSKYSLPVSGSRGGGSRGSRKSVGPYSARESKGDLPPSSNHCTAAAAPYRSSSGHSGNVNNDNLTRGVRARQQQQQCYASDRNTNFDQHQPQKKDNSTGGRVRRISFAEMK